MQFNKINNKTNKVKRNFDIDYLYNLEEEYYFEDLKENKKKRLSKISKSLKNRNRR